VVDGDTTTAWRLAPGAGRPVTLDLRFASPREFGGLTLQWEPGRAARDYDVLLSPDGRTWRLRERIRDGDGGRDDLFLPESEARAIRLVMRRAEGAEGFGLREAHVHPLASGASRNAFFESVARAAPRGHYPRAFVGERPDWTVVGVDGAREEALVSEDGAVEVGKLGFSLEPLLDTGRVVTWHDAERRVSLEDSDLPIPSVEWRTTDIVLTVTAFAIGPADRSSLVVRYRVRNDGGRSRRITLHLAVRPFQVNPPTQFLNTAGGWARVDSVAWEGSVLRVNADRIVVPLSPPARVGTSAFASGEVVSRLARGDAPTATRATDAFGAASTALSWPLDLGPAESREIAVEVPLVGGAPALLHAGDATAATRALAEAAHDWRTRLGRVVIALPPAGEAVARTIRSTQAWILINRDGPAIQPGSRSYERSWIRDGSLTSAALLRFGHQETVRAFLLWFAGHQYPNGKVPCCVDARGADPVPEHDSHGQLIYLAAEYWRHTGDRSTLDSVWPNVVRAAEHLDSLRRTHRTDEYRAPERRALFGLLPASISHEGYSARPMHSYWDDLFALRGFTDAAFLATVLGHGGEAARFAAMRDEFRADLRASIAAAMAQHGTSYVPGAAELGDYDGTSTTVYLSPGPADDSLLPAIRTTFERFWRQVEARRTDSTWENYTPYELRSVGAMLRLGWRERAHALLTDYLADRSPPAWNQWPEIVWREPRIPRFVGDIPHTWVGSDFLRSAADCFAWERERDSALVIGAGIIEPWLASPGVTVRGLSTWWGPLSLTATREDGAAVIRISDGVRVPPGGLVVVSPLVAAPSAADVDGTSIPVVDGAVTVRRLPAIVRFHP
jgi:hypothetical protein